MLPNAPMNDPEYRSHHGIEVDESRWLTATTSFSRDDRRRMMRFRTVETITERHGLLRHLYRVLQWDHGIAATDLMDHLLDVVETTPGRFPLVTWTLGHFDLLPTVAVGWRSFYEEIARLLAEDLSVDPTDTDLQCAFASATSADAGAGTQLPAGGHPRS